MTSEWCYRCHVDYVPELNYGSHACTSHPGTVQRVLTRNNHGQDTTYAYYSCCGLPEPQSNPDLYRNLITLQTPASLGCLRSDHVTEEEYHDIPAARQSQGGLHLARVTFAIWKKAFKAHGNPQGMLASFDTPSIRAIREAQEKATAEGRDNEADVPARYLQVRSIFEPANIDVLAIARQVSMDLLKNDRQVQSQGISALQDILDPAEYALFEQEVNRMRIFRSDLGHRVETLVRPVSRIVFSRWTNTWDERGAQSWPILPFVLVRREAPDFSAEVTMAIRALWRSCVYLRKDMQDAVAYEPSLLSHAAQRLLKEEGGGSSGRFSGSYFSSITSRVNGPVYVTQ